MKSVVLLLIAGAVGICTATAQNSQPRASSAKADPVQAATQPLTPKSAMPAKRKSSAAAPPVSSNNRNSTAELTRLERQNNKATSSRISNAAAAKGPAVKSAPPSSNGSGINATYQKPKVPKKN